MSSPSIGGVTLGEELGRGAMGTVYAGTLDGVSVAVKVLERITDPGLERAFRTEARAMATLAHPNVIGVLDVGTEGTPYVVMERADAVLSSVCGRRPWEEVEGWLRHLLLGLAHAHARGIIHRDLKPGNVLVAGGVAKLADFGLARAFETVGAGNLERPAGTPGYMPIEQRQGRWRDIGPWTDLYALGRVALDLVTRPDGSTLEVPQGFASWVSRLRQERSRDRFRRAADALFAFELLGTPQVALDAGLAGSGPAPESELAMTQPYFEDQDQLAEVLPEPVEVRPVPFPGQPIPLHSEPIARRASMVGLRVGRPVGNHDLAETLWAHTREATERPTLVALRGGGREDWAMWLCHQVHETGIGSVELVTHDPLQGPRSGLGGMLARELRALDLTPRRAVERLEELLHGQTYPGWRARVLTSVMAPALAVGSVDRVEVSRPERHAEVERFVRLDSEDRLPLIWADDVHLGRDVREWIEALLARGRPALIVATLPEGSLPTWLSEHASAVVDLSLPDEATCRSHLMERLGLTGGTAASLAARCGTDLRRARLLLDSGSDSTDAELFSRMLAAVWPPHRDRRVLGCAATLGMHVEGARWRDVCRRARAPWDEDYLEELVASGIATPVGLGGTGDWVFSDPLLRQLVLDGVNARPLHRATALSYPLEAETAIVRAYHLRQSGVPDAALRAISEALPVLASRRDDDRLAGSLTELAALAPTVPEAAVWAEAVRWALGGTEPAELPDGAGSLALLAGERARERGDDDAWMRALDLAEGLAAQAAATDAAEVTWQRAAYLVRRGDVTSVKVALPVLEDALRSIGPSQRAPLTVELAFAHHLLGDRAQRDAVLATIDDPNDGGWLAQLVRDLLGSGSSGLVQSPEVQRVPWLRPLVQMLRS